MTDSVIQYLTTAVARTSAQLLVVFGVMFALAVAIWFVSQGIRGRAAGRLGMAYYWIVAPGVACHETGHALGCLLTGTRITRFVPFHPTSDGTLGYVEHEQPDGGSMLGQVASFVISTGPVWFGCPVIMLLSWLMAGSGFLPDINAYFPAGTPPATGKYVSAVFAAGFEMLGNAVSVWQWRSAWIALYVYGVFCVASEITLSGVDLKHMWKGAGVIVFALFVLNLLPFVGEWINAGIVFAKPMLFVAQVVMAFVLMLDILFFVVVYCVSLIGRG